MSEDCYHMNEFNRQWDMAEMLDDAKTVKKAEEEGFKYFSGMQKWTCNFCGREIHSGFVSERGEHWCREHFEH